MEYKEEILEKCLPKYLEDDLKNYKEGLKNKSTLIDCLLGELQQSINCAYVDNEITEEQEIELLRKLMIKYKDKL